MIKKTAVVLGILILIAVAWVAYFKAELGTELPGPGEITGASLPTPVVLARQQSRLEGAARVGANASKQIMFGDFHVHTTYSTDAFLWSLPMTGGRGVHPIGDACDYARYCSGLDFWGITDHAAASTPRRWQETKDSIRQCNALAGDSQHPDLISFLGFEWTQVGPVPDEHYGHKNVLFRDTDDASTAKRPIAAAGVATTVLRKTLPKFPPALVLSEGSEIDRYMDFNAFLSEIRGVPDCDPDTSSAELPADCFESAATPGELVERLKQQGLEPLIIPHGSTWGFYTPPGTTWDKQLKAEMRPEAFTSIAVMSGHGNSEEYRPWRAVTEVSKEPLEADCPAPSDGYLPSCWRAGQIIQARCLEAGEPAEICAQRAEKARWNYANMSVPGHLSVLGESAEDWLNSGQCDDCFLPAFNYRPGTSVQYGLAISNFDDPEGPLRFRWGFIASSDNHRARPGTGYKPVDRMVTTEANGPTNERWMKRIYGKQEAPSAESNFIVREELQRLAGFQLTELERQSSFWTTGGLAAVHAEERSREAIWAAFQRREIYGTSGPKMLLWFDHLSESGQDLPMGSELQRGANPTFRVRALGAFKQKPGCPDSAQQGLGGERIAQLCSGECDYPSDQRHNIERIEIVRIQPQNRPGEPVESLIQDPWLVRSCKPSQQGCSIEFTDEDFAAQSRDTLYYARAIQEATPTINANNLRCEYDAEGNCLRVNPCYGDFRTDSDDNCTAPAEHRAWSSPIYVDYAVPALAQGGDH